MTSVGQRSITNVNKTTLAKKKIIYVTHLLLKTVIT